MAILCVREKRKRVSVYIYYIHTHILVCVYILIFFRNVLNVKKHRDVIFKILMYALYGHVICYQENIFI